GRSCRNCCRSSPAPWGGRVRAPSTGRPRGRVASHDPEPLRPARGVLAAVAVARQRAAVSARAPRGGGTSLRVRCVHRGARPPAPHVPAADRARACDVRAGTVLTQAHGPHRRSWLPRAAREPLRASPRPCGVGRRVAGATARVGGKPRAGRRTRGGRDDCLPLGTAALCHAHGPRSRLPGRTARRLRALAADRGNGADAALGRSARGRGTGCVRHIRHRARQHCRGRQPLLRSGGRADACARRAAARRSARAVGRAARQRRAARERAGTAHRETVMRAIVRAIVICLALVAGAARAAEPAAGAPAQAPRIVVAFANEPHSAPGPAGTTGSRYGGDGYRVGQSAQQPAHRVALAYSLHEVASWPIKALAIPRVVYQACWQLEPDSDAAACNTFALARALAAAFASGAPLVNLSLAGPSDPLLTALIERGMARGITFVGATGGAGEGFPAAVPGVL